MDLAPIALFVYNRLDHTKRTITALQNNHFANESILYIYSDFPKREKDQENVSSVREYIKSISGFKEVKIILRKINFGLAKSIIEGVTEVVTTYGKIIVMEDDLVTSKFFLKFMNESLNIYEKDLDVISITGYTYPIKNLPETLFLKGADCWTWATWKRGWDLFEPDGRKLLSELIDKKLTRDFDFNGSYHYTKMLKDQIEGTNDSWAVRWYASAFLKGKLTLYPGIALVHNIGNDLSGTHSSKTEAYTTILNDNDIILKKIELKENIEAKQKFEEFFRTQTALLRRIKSYIKRKLKI